MLPILPCFCGGGAARPETGRCGQKTCNISGGYGACFGLGGGAGRFTSFFVPGRAVSARENSGYCGETA